MLHGLLYKETSLKLHGPQLKDTFYAPDVFALHLVALNAFK